MGVFQRPESRFWWIYLEPLKRKIATKIPIGRTAAQQRKSRRLAEDLYYSRMWDLARKDLGRDLLER
jgi:hypothetical protein